MSFFEENFAGVFAEIDGSTYMEEDGTKRVSIRVNALIIFLLVCFLILYPLLV